MERILCAAVHYNDGIEYVHQPYNIKTGIVICGHRHHNCLHNLWILKGEANVLKKLLQRDSQGFLTSENRYVTRKEAFLIAKAAGQLLYPKVFDPEEKDCILISEDLY